MFTSVIKEKRANAQRTALVYLAASVICAVFGAVYESFSHGVYSFYMIYAFAFPLILGLLPFLLLSFGATKKPELMLYCPEGACAGFYHSAVAAFTTGSLMTGVLEIYGTTNRLLGIYWIAGAAFLLAAVLFYLARTFRKLRSLRGPEKGSAR